MALITGRVEDVKLAKSQRSFRVRIGSDWYGAYLPKKDDEDIQAALGKTVAADIDESGKAGPWITRWRVAAGQAEAPVTREPVAEEAPMRPHQANIARAGGLSEPELRFISNCVGQAILAKTIDVPEQIAVWARAAASAIRSVDKPEGDSDIPY